MNIPATASFPSNETVARYEELRANSLNGQRSTKNLGLALFIHKGMAAWMRAWADYTPHPKTNERTSPSAAADVPADIKSSMVMTLVNMIFSRGREAYI